MTRRNYTPAEILSIRTSCRDIFSCFPEGMKLWHGNVDVMTFACIVGQVDPVLLAEEAQAFREWKQQILDGDDDERQR